MTYTATVSNSGNGTAGSVAFQDLLPGKATLVSATPSQGSCSGNPTIVCNLGSLNAGASATVTIVVTASNPGWMTDHGWVSSNPPGNWQHHRSVSVYVHDVSPNLSLKLSGSPGAVDPGQQVTYAATVSNSGNGAAATVAFQDLLPGKATLVSVSPSQGTLQRQPDDPLQPRVAERRRLGDDHDRRHRQPARPDDRSRLGLSEPARATGSTSAPSTPMSVT